jgi:molecular chaperone GrpE (heat shock protein)
MKAVSMLLFALFTAHLAIAQVSTEEAQKRLEEKQRQREAAKPYSELEEENRKLRDSNGRLKAEAEQMKTELEKLRQEVSKSAAIVREATTQITALKDKVERLEVRQARAASRPASRPMLTTDQLHADLQDFADRFAKVVEKAGEKNTGVKRKVMAVTTDLKNRDSLIHPFVGIIVLTDDVMHPNTERPVHWTYTFTVAQDASGGWTGLSANSKLEEGQEEDLPISWYLESLKAANGGSD